jgi:hypothetical protein
MSAQPENWRLRSRNRQELIRRREVFWQAFGINAGRDCLAAVMEINSIWLAETHSGPEAKIGQ